MTGEVEVVEGGTLEEMAAAHPKAHAIWKARSFKRTLAVKYAGDFWHLKCFTRHQKSCAPGKWPKEDSFVVSGGQTIIRQAVCPHCRKPVLKV